MRLLFLSERYPPDLGGVATSAGRISRAIAGIGVDVDVITWMRTLDAGVVVERAGNPSVFSMGRFREWDATLPHTLNLVDWLAGKHSYDVIWGHYLAPAGFLAAWLGRLKNISSVVSIRGNDLDRDMYPPGDFARLIWTLEQGSCVTAVTADLARKVTALCGRGDVVPLKNAVDCSVFGQAGDFPGLREKLGIQPEEAVLGFAGELREKKGQQFLIEALRRVRDKRPACLLLIGEVRPSELPRLMQWTGAGTLEEHRILVTGQLRTPAEVNAHLQLCDVYLQPSLWDGMPNALLEAMAAGCFVIGSDAGGIPEVIQDGLTGVIVRRWELHGLSGVVLDWLARPPDERQRIGLAAREHMLRDFGFAQERSALQAILRRLIPSSS
ncbi:MAG TPA: glycosyltransferase [Bryobacteraceae bacterium]|nr:glycosyltransferase [Bryobacteraceae bacterium]